MYDEEIFAEVYGYDNLYEISNFARLRTKRWGKEGYKKEYRYIQPRKNEHGYLCVNLPRNGRQKTVYIHRLVAEAFVINPQKLPEVNHKDENKYNNRADNLEWCTHVDNCNYGTRNDRTTEKNKRPVICVETGIVYDSCTSAAEAMGVGKTAISNCVNGRSKSCSGYTWRKADV